MAQLRKKRKFELGRPPAMTKVSTSCCIVLVKIRSQFFLFLGVGWGVDLYEFSTIRLSSGALVIHVTERWVYQRLMLSFGGLKACCTLGFVGISFFFFS